MSALGCSWQGDTSYLCWDGTWLQPDQVSSTSPPFLGSSWSVCPSSRASPSPKQLYFKNEAEPLRANYRSGDGTAAQSRAPLGPAHTQGHQQLCAPAEHTGTVRILQNNSTPLLFFLPAHPIDFARSQNPAVRAAAHFGAAFHFPSTIYKTRPC